MRSCTRRDRIIHLNITGMLKRLLNGRNRLRRRKRESILRRRTERGLCSVQGCWQCQDKTSVMHTSITWIQAPTNQQGRIQALNCIKRCSLRFTEISSSVFQPVQAVRAWASSPSHRVENETAHLLDTNGSCCSVSFNIQSSKCDGAKCLVARLLLDQSDTWRVTGTRKLDEKVAALWVRVAFITSSHLPSWRQATMWHCLPVVPGVNNE